MFVFLLIHLVGHPGQIKTTPHWEHSAYFSPNPHNLGKNSILCPGLCAERLSYFLSIQIYNLCMHRSCFHFCVHFYFDHRMQEYHESNHMLHFLCSPSLLQTNCRLLDVSLGNCCPHKCLPDTRCIHFGDEQTCISLYTCSVQN